MATSPGNEDAPVTLDDLLEQLAAFEQEPEDWIPGEVTAKGALAIALALREVAEAIRGQA